ncbi:Nuclease associated modular domain 3 [Dillenia turbinata]|uniref:Nuclease associated modular domain 3 n=1 Tax=Dillenia turbinata TaxID=194707 RepID=A0AAN8WHL2_9MAGN
MEQVQYTLLRQPSIYQLECKLYCSHVMQVKYPAAPLKNMHFHFGSFGSLERLPSPRTLDMNVALQEIYDVKECNQEKLDAKLCQKETLNGLIQSNSDYDFVEVSSKVNHKERERRRRIALANKGKVPWNKGRKHSAETREKIKQRTIEALRNPKVRKKMAEYPRTHSEQTKSRIRSALGHLWAERLKWKRMREKFFLSWAENIARAAKKGFDDQEELTWDAYDKIKEEIILQHLHRAAEKAKAKEITKMRKLKAAQSKAEKMARLAQKRKDMEHMAEVRGERRRKAQGKSKEERKKSAVARALKLRERLTKIYKKKSVSGQVRSERELASSHRPSWEELDMKIIRRDRLRREASLEDEIRAAKDRRAEFVDSTISAGYFSGTR